MSEDARIEAAYPRAVQAGRWAMAVVLAGLLAALAWMFLLQEGHTGQIFNRKWTEHNFPDGLGLALGYEDTARGGALATVGLGIALAIVFALVQNRLPGGHRLRGLILAAGIFVLWGLVFTPLVDSRQILDIETAEFQYLPTGLFGVEAGGWTIASGVVASLAAGLIIAKVVPLVRDAAWWREHPATEHGVLVGQADELFEFTEERAKQRVEGPR